MLQCSNCGGQQADTGYYNYLEIIDVVDESIELLIKPQKGKQYKIASGFDKANILWFLSLVRTRYNTIIMAKYYIYDVINIDKS